MCDESDGVLRTTLAQNAGIVGGSFKRYKFRLTTKRRHVTSNARHYTESSQAVLMKALTLYTVLIHIPGTNRLNLGTVQITHNAPPVLGILN